MNKVEENVRKYFGYFARFEKKICIATIQNNFFAQNVIEIFNLDFEISKFELGFCKSNEVLSNLMDDTLNIQVTGECYFGHLKNRDVHEKHFFNIYEAFIFKFQLRI